ncbi:hypothetical protein ACHAPU_003140 [Fusarium lateritium]
MTRILDLPNELIHQICESLLAKDLIALRLSCRDLNGATIKIFAARLFYTRKVGSKKSHIKTLMSIAEHPLFGPTLRQVELHSSYISFPMNLFKLIKKPRHMYNTLKMLPNLKSLVIEADRIQDPPEDLRLPQVAHVHLKLTKFGPQVDWSSDDSQFRNFMSCFPELTEFTLEAGGETSGDGVFRTIVRSLHIKNLLALRFTNFDITNPADMAHCLSSHGATLQRIHFDRITMRNHKHWAYVFDAVSGLPKIRNFYLGKCVTTRPITGIDDMTLDFISNECRSAGARELLQLTPTSGNWVQALTPSFFPTKAYTTSEFFFRSGIMGVRQVYGPAIEGIRGLEDRPRDS